MKEFFSLRITTLFESHNVSMYVYVAIKLCSFMQYVFNLQFNNEFM